VTCITFSPDGRQLVSSSIDGTTHTWNATNGKTINMSKSLAVSFKSGSSRSFAFSMERGWCQEDADDALLRWYPVDNPDFGQWAYIDNKIIRRDKSGLITIKDIRKAYGELHDRSARIQSKSRDGPQKELQTYRGSTRSSSQPIKHHLPSRMRN